MSTIKNVFVSLFVTLMTGFVSIIGMLAGFAWWENGGADWFEEKTKKLFNR